MHKNSNKTEPTKRTDDKEKSKIRHHLGVEIDQVVITIVFLVCFFLGFAVISYLPEGNDLAAMIALSSIAFGSLIGFLFGVPRILQGQDNEAKDIYRMNVNTNLEQISDWLTKIIVGVGLIELNNIPGFLNRIAKNLSFGLGADENSQWHTFLAASLIVYFLIIGFIFSYLLTRVYLAKVFWKADQNEIDLLRRNLRTNEEKIETVMSVATTGIGKQSLKNRDVQPENISSDAHDDSTFQNRNETSDGNSDDPQKGLWGGKSMNNNRIIKADVKSIDADNDFFKITLSVESTDSKNYPLTGNVTFHLHDTFDNPNPIIKVKNGKAILNLVAYGAFTVGAEADEGKTQLEIDLSELPNAPMEFRMS